ncbi:ABC transporter ATP-binding protein [Saccharicrinis fermentans]|uniref:Daunorubicin/doxorubicin resistance ATP-binding protein DrrA n=1 Tax=Saccharicrinis fermentans DSM 9555 = JCM 21142 TaxID=869213 RepID=W7Y205_9BACT|nr:ABC transporter ATP-binding protein [Saccharicrinis fermentans]GAF04910.1 daunorubicin/doxorubicin resistance ATP-binding protein DrrA [Saccharicrinis fermentans DSM 9555 = JCM 21142]
MNLLEASGVVKKYANHLALDNLDVQVPKNKIFGLLGPNGAGKTTFIRIINHITMPDKGEILFDGIPLNAEDIYRVGYLPEERGLYKKMKVGEQAMYLARLKGMSKSDAFKKLKYWFEKFEIAAWWDKKVEELSKGMQQKVQFIVTVLHEPELLIFDEPFSGFDPINANLLKQEILELKDKGSTIIFSTHNMSSVEELCDNICLINKSKSILKGNVEEVKHAFKNNEVMIEFNGDDNLFKAKLNDDYQIKSLVKKHDSFIAKIKLTSEDKTNHLLTTLLPDFKIRSFQEILPNMDEVFIKAVEKSNAAY